MQVKEKIIINHYIQKDPLSKENLDKTLNLVNRIRLLFGDTKTVWLYTGFIFEECIPTSECSDENIFRALRLEILKNVDVLVDGRFEKDKLDLSLPYRGSTNQRLIDVKATLRQNKIILYEI